MENQEVVPEKSGTLAELAQIRAETRATATGKGVETKPAEEIPPAETPAEESLAIVEPEDLIKIGDRTFKTQSEAIKYAEELEHAKEVAESHSLGVQEALQAIRQPAAPVTPPEDDKFEEKFYTNPKATLAEIKQQAKNEALAAIRQEQAINDQWKMFFDENPDLEGQKLVAQQVLNDNASVFNQMNDLPKARKLLATKTRAIFQDYAERQKPRTQLPDRGTQAVSPSRGAGVTPTVEAKVEKPLDFVSQMRNARRSAK